jgi:hypothetical protein
MHEEDIRTGAQLQAQFPYMFTGDNIGFAFYRGWMPIVVQVCFEIDVLLGDQREEFYWTQIKEKFGTLRLYYAFGDQSSMTMDIQSRAGLQSIRIQPGKPSPLGRGVDKLVVRAEEDTAVVCMVCGAPAIAQAYDHYWLTLCEVHHPDRVRKLDEHRHEGVWRLARCRKDDDDGW